jgi:hypothetical protein
MSFLFSHRTVTQEKAKRRSLERARRRRLHDDHDEFYSTEQRNDSSSHRLIVIIVNTVGAFTWFDWMQHLQREALGFGLGLQA